MKEQILNEILEERKKQDQQWGEQNHVPIEWCAILVEEVGEVSKAALETHFKYGGKNDYIEYRNELIQVAAVSLAMIECLDRNRNDLHGSVTERVEA
ncbi:MazG-like family protein [Leptospira interrogans]|uniref:MazG-like family protein n=1 Tax=Leptospira interrogans TaxID=173 RepID=UPI0003482A59|nr:MazG-like family protein [Leptospira interrogans]